MSIAGQEININSLRDLIGNILYLDDVDVINEDTKIFSELNLSSIDYIDLCFGLKKLIGKDVGPDDLWPFNKMMTNPDFFSNGQWTEEGWKKICAIFEINVNQKQETVRDLYQRFTPAYLLKIIGKL